jgi:cation transporter-like permease
MDVLTQEATEDFHKVGTVGALPVNVRDATISLLYRKRVSWLVLLVFANIFSGAGIAYFEDTIAAHMALLFFLPLLIASAGNAGAQASTLMVRALATGDVVMKDWGHMLGREALVAAALGVTMAFAVSGIGLLRGGPDIALVVALTMVAVVLTGSLSACRCRSCSAASHRPGDRQRPPRHLDRRHCRRGHLLLHRQRDFVKRLGTARNPSARRLPRCAGRRRRRVPRPRRVDGGGSYSASACFHSALAFCQASGRPSAAHCW